MSKEKKSKETYREIVKPMADDLRKAESWCDLDGVLNRSETMYNLYKMGYRKQSEWISVEEMDCKKCLHYEMCLENFREAKKQGLWELTDEEEYFSHADECDFFITGYRKQSVGEWLITTFAGGSSAHIKCSNCGHNDIVQDERCDFIRVLPKYCSNCGAEMKGGGDKQRKEESEDAGGDR